MNLLLKMIFKSSIISTFVSTGQLIFFLWYLEFDVHWDLNQQPAKISLTLF